MIYPILGLLGVVGLLVGGIGVLTWRRRPDPGTQPFSLMALGIAWWVGSMILAHLVDQALGLHAVFVFLTRVEWFGIFVMTVSWFLFALEYTGRSEFVNRRVARLLLLVPLGVYPVAFANGVILDAAGSVLGRSLELTGAFDPWLAVEPFVLAYVYSLLVTSTVILLVFLFTSRLPHPEVAVLWLLALIIPWTVNALYMSGVIPPLGPAKIDPTPFGFVGLAGVGFVAIRRSESFEMAPLARAYVVDNLEVGILVFDSDFRIVDANEYARSILQIDASGIGRDIREVVAAAVSTGSEPGDVPTDDSFVATLDQQVLTIDASHGPRKITVEIAPLDPVAGWDRGRTDSYGMVLRDETTHIERQSTLERQTEQLEVLNQVIRHDIRNDMQVVGGLGDLLRDHVDNDGHTYVDTVVEKADYVVELTRDVGNITEAILAETDELEATELGPVLDREVAEVDASFEAATIRWEGVEGITVRANDMLGSVFRNLIQNAIVHNDSESPEVTVEVTERPDSVVVSVADNGPGIPPEQRERVFERGERGQKSSGSGLGLYLVETLVEQYGGQVWIEPSGAEESDGEVTDHSDAEAGGGGPGTAFSIELPRAESPDA